MDVSTQAISYAEQGSKTMRPENLVKLSRISGVTTDYLLTGETLADKLSHLTNEEMVFVEMIINSCIGLCNLKNTRHK